MTEKHEQGMVAELMKALKTATTELQDVGALHELDCPEDDTCACALPKVLNGAIARATPEAVRKADAAPELLAACKEWETIWQPGNKHEAAWQRLVDAIAKAEGRS